MDVKSVAKLNPSAPDEDVLDWANRENGILITLDKDFGELIFRLKKIHAGVILIRIDRFAVSGKIEFLLELIRKNEQTLYKSFTVIQENLIRIRQVK